MTNCLLFSLAILSRGHKKNSFLQIGYLPIWMEFGVMFLFCKLCTGLWVLAEWRLFIHFLTSTSFPKSHSFQKMTTISGLLFLLKISQLHVHVSMPVILQSYYYVFHFTILVLWIHNLFEIYMVQMAFLVCGLSLISLKLFN
jgi:hypothetical protein